MQFFLPLQSKRKIKSYFYSTEELEYIFCYFHIKYELFPSVIFQNIKPILCSTLAKEFVCFYISIIDQMNTLIHVFFCSPQLKPL